MDNIKEKLVNILCGTSDLWPRCDAPTGDCRGCLKLADHLIAQGVTFATDNNVGGKWISVEERLPVYGEKVLVCDTHEDFVGIAVLQKGKYIWWSKKENYWRWNDMDMAFGEFTHWMPLPEPPTEAQ